MRRLHTKLGFYEGTFVAGKVDGSVHDGVPLPYRKGQLKCNASAELTEFGLNIRPVFGESIAIARAQVRGVVLGDKGVSKESWGCERVLNVLWEKDGNYLCSVVVIMYSSKCLPCDWKVYLESLVCQADIPEALPVLLERVRQGFFEQKALNTLAFHIFLAVIGILLMTWTFIGVV